jgi:hypothetical protein
MADEYSEVAPSTLGLYSRVVSSPQATFVEYQVVASEDVGK